MDGGKKIGYVQYETAVSAKKAIEMFDNSFQFGDEPILVMQWQQSEMQKFKNKIDFVIKVDDIERKIIHDALKIYNKDEEIDQDTFDIDDFYDFVHLMIDYGPNEIGLQLR